MALLNNVTTTGASAPLTVSGSAFTVQLSGATTSGSGSASANVEVSNDGVNWMIAGTVSLVLSTTSTSDGLVVQQAPWRLMRVNVTTLTGTGAAVFAMVGV